jgi:putative ABC transport system substrate-binding protein
MNNRRKLLMVLGAGALAAPLAALAQEQGRVWRVGFLSNTARPASLSHAHSHGAFLRGMRELGYIEGKNLVMEYRFGEGRTKRLPALAAQLAQLKVDVIVAAGINAVRAAQKATSVIPIVMISVNDPVDRGLIKSLAWPGGNVTGLSSMTNDISHKRLQMLLDMVPKLSRLAALVNPTARGNIRALESIQAAGQTHHIEVLRADARTPQEIDNAFFLISQQNADALIVLFHPIFQEQRSRIAALTAQYRLPSMTSDRVYVEAGCLMSYGYSLAEQYGRAPTYVDKIFKGVRPSDLPVEQPTKFELIINEKTAKALGLTIPQSLLISADKVIE